MKTYQTLPTPPEACPESAWGHSWQTLSHTEHEVTQRCRFCRQSRTLPTWKAAAPRQVKTRQK